LILKGIVVGRARDATSPVNDVGTGPVNGGITTGWPTPRVAGIVLLALFVLAALRIATTYREFNAVIDEGRHIAAAVEVYDRGTFAIYPHSPPLPRWINGLLPYLGGARLPRDDETELAAFRQQTRGDWEYALGKYVLESGDYWGTLTRARIGTLVFLGVLMLYAYRWGALLYGRFSGVAAAALISTSPNLLAHSGLATVDVAFAASTFAAAYHFWRWTSLPGARAWLAVVLSFTIAFLCKFPAPGFLVWVYAAFALLARHEMARRWRDLRGRRARVVAARVLTLVVVLFLCTWAAYQFSVGTLAGRSPWLPGAIDNLLAPGSFANRVCQTVAQDIAVPMPQVFEGAHMLYKEGTRPWRAYLLGEIGYGFYLFFPVAFAVKCTLGFLAMLLASGSLLVAQRRRDLTAGTAYIAVGGAVFLALLIVKRMNIGLRHALPVYPYAAVLASALFAQGLWARKLRWPRVLGALLLLFHAGDAALAHPDYLAYFNQIARGRESEFLLDSNLDWGQDLARLKRYLDAHSIDEITLSVFGAQFGTSPEALGIRGARLLDAHNDPTFVDAFANRPHGWFAVSYNFLYGIGMSISDYEKLKRFAWLPRTPQAVIGKSILLYRFD
jgi:4-amino-4-deoxy-L-arabinose transferase-like glycosyltransferase